MKYAIMAQRIMDSGGTPVDWYNDMSDSLYDFYERVMGLVYEALLAKGYYMEASASSGSGIVEVYTLGTDNEPSDDVIASVDMEDETALFFELVSSDEFRTARAVAKELTAEYLDLIANNSGSTSQTSISTDNSTKYWYDTNHIVSIDAQLYPNLCNDGLIKKIPHDKLIQLFNKYLPNNLRNIYKVTDVIGNSASDQLTVVGLCDPGFSDVVTQGKHILDLIQDAADKVCAEVN